MATTTDKKRAKPYPDWPMHWHASGYWCKTVRKKKYYFGNRGSAADGPEFDEIAIADYNANIVSIKAGAGRVVSDGATVRDIVVDFLIARQELVETGELAVRSFRDYERVGRIMAKYFGETRVGDLRADTLAAYRKHLQAGGRGVNTVANYVRISRIILRFANQTLGLEIPPFTQFKEPPRKAIRKARNQQRREHGAKMFEAAQIRAILNDEKTSVQMRAMVLLGVNAGYGNKDCSELRLGDWTMRGGRYWLEVPRVKTEVERRCVLWPETIAALEDVAKIRPKAKTEELDDRVFLTIRGNAWVRDVTSNNDEVAKQFTKLLREVADPATGQPMKRRGLSFYALRHTTETIGDRSRDTAALNLIMGHADGSMAGVYRERIDDDRLIAVADHLHAWLFG